jgi:hypothetical protein
MASHRNVADKDDDIGIDQDCTKNLGKGRMGFHYIRRDTEIPAVEEDTQPSRISHVRNVETPMESTKVVGQSQERRKSPVGIGRTKKRMPSAER